MKSFRFTSLSIFLLVLVVACSSSNDSSNDTTETSNNDAQVTVTDVTVVWEVSGRVSDFAPDINIRLGQLNIMNDSVLIGAVKTNDLFGYYLRYSLEDGAAQSPLDFVVAHEGVSTANGGIRLEDVVADTDGTYWAVTGTRGAPIIHFDANGVVLSTFGESPASGEEELAGQIRGASDIFIGADNNLYIHESRLKEVPEFSVWSKNGEFLREFSYLAPGNTRGFVSMSALGQLVITPYTLPLSNHGFDVLDLEGNIVRENVASFVAIANTPTTNSDPILAVHVDANNHAVFVTQNHLYRLDSESQITHIYDAPLARNTEDVILVPANKYRWLDVVFLPDGDAIALYANPEQWVLTRISFD